MLARIWASDRRRAGPRAHSLSSRVRVGASRRHPPPQRHRQPGNSLVSRALNRRLLIDALAAANRVELPPPQTIQAPPTPRTELYDGVLADLRDFDRYGAVVDARELAALEALLERRPESGAAGRFGRTGAPDLSSPRSWRSRLCLNSPRATIPFISTS